MARQTAQQQGVRCQSTGYPTISRLSTECQETKLEVETLSALLALMPFLLLLDGLDEVGAVEDRERIVLVTREMLTWFGQKNARAVVIATTRPQGYAGELSRIGISLITKYLAYLSPDDALTYARKLVESKIPGADLQERTLERLRAAARETATSRLLRTPLQVTILTALVQQGRAPSERWKLFWSYFDFAYRREIEHDTYASELLATRRGHIQAIHMRVALLLQVEAETAGGAAARMSRDRLQGIVDAVLKEDEVDDEERADLVRRIVDAAEKRLVFLVEPEPGNFGFEIRSLQEFMAAWALAEGRDASVESRLLQVAKAPLFRNVVLFVASKLFSERSALRDMLADRVCGTLDNDSSDTLSRITKAGALLALDVLEEGSALAQPKRARALMERAVDLLDLPAGREHGRLARTVTDDTAPVLRAALEARLARSAMEETIGMLGVWTCIIEATNLGHVWADQIGEAFWSTLKDPAQVVEACLNASIPLGRWIRPRIEADLDSFPPEIVRNGAHIVLQDQKKNAGHVSWVDVVARSSHRRPYHPTVRLRDSYFALTPLPPRTVRQSPLVEATTGSMPPNWRAWIAAEMFYEDPSAARLAETLRFAAEALPREKWSWLAHRSPWPLQACLNAANGPPDLIRFADLLTQGQLGDAGDWYQAEKSWRTDGSFCAVIDSVTDGFPWTLASLSTAPPLTGSSFTSMVGRSAKEIPRMLQHATHAFRACYSSVHKERVANICLSLLWVLPSTSRTDMAEVQEWLNAITGRLDVPLRRPKQIFLQDWLRILDIVGQRRQFEYSHESVESAEAYVKNPENLGLLYRTMAAVMTGPASRLGQDLKARLKNCVAAQSYETRPARADAATLKVWLGAMIDADADNLFHDVAIQASSEHLAGYFLLSAIKNGDLSDALRESLLMKIYTDSDADRQRWLAPRTMDVMRAALQSRRSGLGSIATWDRLELPLPHPLVPAAAARRAVLPESPIVLRELHIQHIRGLRDLKLQFAPPLPNRGQWIVILGPNGAGKTTLLRSLVLALRNLHDPKIWPKGAFATQWHEIDEPGDARISVQVVDYGEHTTRIRSNGSEKFFQIPEQEAPYLFPVFAYGCRRGSALGGAQREVDLGDDDGPEVATLFDEGAPLVHAETWLIQWDGDAQKNVRSKAIFEAVRAALRSLLAVTSIEVRDQRVWISEGKGVSVPFKALSDGYITSAGWFLDLIARWIPLADRNGVLVDANFMEHMTGLVLLDEIDLHLHPRWQIESIERTRKLLPSMSFVVTTHNPLTLVGAKPEEIWVLSHDSGRIRASHGTETPMLLTGGQIYSKYFGIDDVHPHELGKKLRRYGFLSGYALRDDAEQSEMDLLRDDLRRAGIEPGWDEVTRETSMTLPSKKAKRPALLKKQGAEK